MCARLFGATRYVAHPLNTSIAIFFQEKEYGSHNNIFFFIFFFSPPGSHHIPWHTSHKHFVLDKPCAYRIERKLMA